MALQVEMYLLVTISISLPMPELLTKVSCRKDCKRISTESSLTSPRLQKRSRDFFFPLSDHNHQVNYFVAMVRAGYVRVAIIHRTLTWTTGSLTCAQISIHAIAHGGVRTPKESLHWKLTLGRKSLAAPGNRTFVSGVPVRYSSQLSYIPSPELTELISTATDSPFVGVGHTHSRRRWVNCKKAFAFISLSLKAIGPSTMADSHNFESQQPG